MDESACPGRCNSECECVSFCGNDFAEPDEECDGADDINCPSRCEPGCTCPPRFCGNNFTDPEEECDGLSSENCSDGVCRAPGDPAGECTCACEVRVPCVDPPVVPVAPRMRFLSIEIPAQDLPKPFAIELELISIYEPEKPFPVDPPDFAEFEGKKRYVRLFRDGEGLPITDCLDSAAFQTTYKCATLGCEPELLQWAELFGDQHLFITGDAVVPDSIYVLRAGILPETACKPEGVQLITSRWGDTDSSGVVNVTDVVKVVDRVKDVFNAVPETAALLHPASPTPHLSNPNVLDVTLTVDALKLVAYPYGIATCP